MRFLTILSSLVPANGLMWHVLTDEDDIQVLMEIKALRGLINYA